MNTRSRGLIPLDDVRRQDNLVFAAFHAANLTGNTVTSEEMMGAPRYLITSFTEQLRRERPGETGTRALELDAELIVLAVTGISQAVLAGGTTRETAVELLDHLLDRVFTGE
ncbi:hypothetical protein ACFXPS_24000 [Nocardia sp. NPDC059091]|uniref:hypothetical protein n=1 Tax=unclassified Nocardia TaxID=2637762 RepID=UPI003689104A